VNTYEVEVIAYLNSTYTVVVDADSEEAAQEAAEHEVYGVIEPDDIQVTAGDTRAL
jgi:hypothetical protein